VLLPESLTVHTKKRSVVPTAKYQYLADNKESRAAVRTYQGFRSVIIHPIDKVQVDTVVICSPSNVDIDSLVENLGSSGIRTGEDSVGV